MASDSKFIDWEETSREEIKALYKGVLILKKRLHMDWSDVFLAAFGPRDSVGNCYEDNFRKGQVSSSKAYKLFVWLDKNDPALASSIEDDILAIREAELPENTDLWNALLLKGQFSNVDVCKAADQLGMASLARREPIHDLKLKLMEEFIFHLNIPFEGHLIAFQGYKGKWYPQLISKDGNMIQIPAGQQTIPYDHQSSKPLALCEETDTGKHSFAFLLTRNKTVKEILPPINQTFQAIPAKIRNDLARYVLQEKDVHWRLFRINLMFVSS